MEFAPFVAKPRTSFAQLFEVLCSFWAIVAVEADCDAPGRSAPNLDIKIHFVPNCLLVVGGCLRCHRTAKGSYLHA